MTRTRALAGSALMLLAVAVTGCSNEKAPDAVTLSTGAASTATTSGSSPTPATSSSSPDPVQTVAPLSQAQLTAALPAASALRPKGWKVVKSTTSPNSGKDKITPAACQAVWDSLKPDLATGKHASADRDYKISEFGPFVSVTNTSYTQLPPADAFTALATTVSRCPAFTSTDRKGVKTKWKVSPLKFPNVGDQTFAIRMTGKISSKGFTLSFTADVAIAFKGATSVGVVNLGLGKLVSPATTLSTLNSTLSRLPG